MQTYFGCVYSNNHPVMGN